jgi:hypothetical protein
VIPADKQGFVPATETYQKVQGIRSLAPSVNIIPEKNQEIIRLRSYHVQDLFKSPKTSVDIPYDQDSHKDVHFETAGA